MNENELKTRLQQDAVIFQTSFDEELYMQIMYELSWYRPTYVPSMQVALGGGTCASFEDLVHRFQTGILRYFLFHYRLEDSRVLTKRTFVKAWESHTMYNSRWQFSTWFLMVAHQQNVRYFQKQTQAILRFVDGDETIPPEKNAANLWVLARKNLPREEAEVLWLFYVEKKSRREIAEIIQKTVPDVKSLLFSARDALCDSGIPRGISSLLFSVREALRKIL